jgi:hypothetical protein
MITLRFLGLVIKFALLTVVAVVVEHAVIVSFWGFALAAAITVGLFLLITAGLYREWRASAAGHFEQTTWLRSGGRR